MIDDPNVLLESIMGRSDTIKGIRIMSASPMIGKPATDVASIIGNDLFKRNAVDLCKRYADMYDDGKRNEILMVSSDKALKTLKKLKSGVMYHIYLTEGKSSDTDLVNKTIQLCNSLVNKIKSSLSYAIMFFFAASAASLLLLALTAGKLDEFIKGISDILDEFISTFKTVSYALLRAVITFDLDKFRKSLKVVDKMKNNISSTLDRLKKENLNAAVAAFCITCFALCLLAFGGAISMVTHKDS